MKFSKFDWFEKFDSFDRTKTVTMRYLHGKIKANKGGKITVTISKKTRVLILTEKDFKRYKNNQTYTYFGGVKEGSYDFTATKSGVWHVVVEKGSYHKPENIKAARAIYHNAKAVQDGWVANSNIVTTETNS